MGSMELAATLAHLVKTAEEIQEHTAEELTFDKIDGLVEALKARIAEERDERETVDVEPSPSLERDVAEMTPFVTRRHMETRPDYRIIAAEIGDIVESKQEAYGDSFGRSGAVLRILYPEGLWPEQYDDMLAVARIIDKLFRVATDRDAFGESPFRDIAGCGILGAGRTAA